MGDRAGVIFTDKDGNYSPTCYLHWNGGPDSIYAFLAELGRRKVRVNDPAYELARFIHIVGDFFDNTDQGCTSMGLGCFNSPAELTEATLKSHVDDNGVYVVSRHNKACTVARYDDEGKWSKTRCRAERSEACKSECYKYIVGALKKSRPKVSSHG